MNTTDILRLIKKDKEIEKIINKINNLSVGFIGTPTSYNNKLIDEYSFNMIISYAIKSVTLGDVVPFLEKFIEEIEKKGFVKAYKELDLAICQQLTPEGELRTNKDKITTNDREIKDNNINTFYKILQGKAINFISKIRTNNLAERIDMLGNAEIKVDNTFTLRIKEYSTLVNGISTTAYMLLDCLLIHFTEQPIKDAKVRLPLKRYMELRELNNPKSAREQVLKDMKTLQLIEYEAREKIKGKWHDSGNISIYGGTAFIKSGVIHFNFNADFFNTLMNYQVMDYAKETLRLNPKKNPHSYYFSKYIDENYRMNEGKRRVSVITLATLIKKAPLLPTYEEVINSKEKNGNIYKYIIEPVIRDLDSINRLLYDFIDAKGNIIEIPHDYFKGKGGYEKFISCKIKIDYNEYQQNLVRIDQYKKHLGKEKKTKKKPKKK